MVIWRSGSHCWSKLPEEFLERAPQIPAQLCRVRSNQRWLSSSLFLAWVCTMQFSLIAQACSVLSCFCWTLCHVLLCIPVNHLQFLGRWGQGLVTTYSHLWSFILKFYAFSSVFYFHGLCSWPNHMGFFFFLTLGPKKFTAVFCNKGYILKPCICGDIICMWSCTPSDVLVNWQTHTQWWSPKVLMEMKKFLSSRDILDIVAEFLTCLVTLV